jgi:hypothetical protein
MPKKKGGSKKPKGRADGGKKSKGKKDPDEVDGVRILGEDDIEALLANAISTAAQSTTVTLVPCEKPSARANFSMTHYPATDEYIMYGGEYFDGAASTCYTDMYRWRPEEQTWVHVLSPNPPPPRCSHQSVLVGHTLYVFGGEFTTTEQFHHYKDMWALDCKTNLWREVEAKGGPSPRSGHRMVLWGQHLVCFGGFFEPAAESMMKPVRVAPC